MVRALGPHILVTGFGPFFQVEENPSRTVAFALADAPPDGVRVSAVELPVDVATAGEAIDRAVASVEPVDLLLALGVQRDAYFRVERRARFRLTSQKPDNSGVVTEGIELEPARDFETRFDVEACARVLRASGAADVRTSDDAGGFVCERVYHHVLALGARRPLPGLFLHLPPHDALSAEEQLPHVRALLPELASQARAFTSTPA